MIMRVLLFVLFLINTHDLAEIGLFPYFLDKPMSFFIFHSNCLLEPWCSSRVRHTTSKLEVTWIQLLIRWEHDQWMGSSNCCPSCEHNYTAIALNELWAYSASVITSRTTLVHSSMCVDVHIHEMCWNGLVELRFFGCNLQLSHED